MPWLGIAKETLFARPPSQYVYDKFMLLIALIAVYVQDFGLAVRLRNHWATIEEGGKDVYSASYRPLECWQNYASKVRGARSSSAVAAVHIYAVCLSTSWQMELHSSADISAFGATAFQLLSGLLLFPVKSDAMLEYLRGFAEPEQQVCAWEREVDRRTSEFLTSSSTYLHELGRDIVRGTMVWQSSRYTWETCQINLKL